MPATLIPNDDDEEEPINTPAEQPIITTSPAPPTATQEKQLTPNTTKTTLPHHSQSEGVVMEFTTMPHIIFPETPNQPLLKADQTLFICLHEQLGHCSFHQLCQLAKRGIIPKRLAKVPIPKCPSCLYGKAYRKPWRTHKVNPKIKKSTNPRAVISVNQLESPLPGFVPITKGTPTLQRYRGATVFVSHASDFIYVHVHKALTGQETINAKHTFE